MILLGGFLKGVFIQDLEHCIALQFTGMLDKNGNEIYDGDVIKDSWRENQPYGYSPDEEYNKEDVFIVEYKDYSFNLEEKRSRSQTCIEGFYREVIGNIFDNAELVKP